MVSPCTPIELKDLLEDLSWNLKLKLLNDVVPKYPSMEKDHNLEVITRKAPSPVPVGYRRTAIKPDQPKRRDETQASGDPKTNDDSDMRIKLFRLMYETVRDSDLKVKRAELIREHYVNSTAFEIGYLLGDVTDKHNIITDISTTLERFYREWKPIEHINAYEQISNQAMEINHLVDLIRIVSKRDES